MSLCLCELSSPALNLQILHVLLSAVLGVRRNHNQEDKRCWKCAVGAIVSVQHHVYFGILLAVTF